LESIPYRLRYKKNEPYISQIDLLNVFRRAFRRAGLPIAYSEGFNPQPVLSFGPALPLGFTGSDEVMDFKLSAVMDENEIIEKMASALPAAVTPLRIKKIAKEVRPINRTVEKALYTYDSEFEITDQVIKNIETLKNSAEIIITHVTPKKTRTKDFKPFLVDIRLSDNELGSTAEGDPDKAADQSNGNAKKRIVFELRMENGNLPNPSQLLPLIFKEEWNKEDHQIIHLCRTSIELDESPAKPKKKKKKEKPVIHDRMEKTVQDSQGDKNDN
jgi:radical SAM-linked protein